MNDNPTSSATTHPSLPLDTPVANTSMLPEAMQPATGAKDLMKRVVQGAHDGIDRLADKAAPAVQQLGASVSGAQEALQAKADELLDTRDGWVASVRSTVRANPLLTLAAALALGTLIARITR